MTRILSLLLLLFSPHYVSSVTSGGINLRASHSEESANLRTTFEVQPSRILNVDHIRDPDEIDVESNGDSQPSSIPSSAPTSSAPSSPVIPPIIEEPNEPVSARSGASLSAPTIASITAGGAVLLLGAAYLSTRRVHDPAEMTDPIGETYFA